MKKNGCLIRIPAETKRRLLKMKKKDERGIGSVVTRLTDFKELNNNKKVKRRIIEEIEF